VLEGGRGDLVSAAMLEALAANLGRARNATQEAERWLGANHLQRLVRETPEREFPATIRHINSSGFFVRLTENGLEGFVDLRGDPEKFSYDKWTASLTSTTRRFRLEQAVRVVLDSIEPSSHQALFRPAAGCGAKPAVGDTAALS